jgi:hypothetical protein
MEHHGNTFHGTPFSNRVGAHSGESTLLLDLQNKLDAERDINMSCPGALTFKPWDMPKYLSFHTFRFVKCSDPKCIVLPFIHQIRLTRGLSIKIPLFG